MLCSQQLYIGKAQHVKRRELPHPQLEQSFPFRL
jgi:hypothetical protein